MQHSVAILLNEREPQKKELASALERELSAQGITPYRIESTPNLLKEIGTRKPHVLIVDYILEDYGTGLDIAAELLADESPYHPTVLFFTDEPSREVGIAAMKLGAKDYFLATEVHAVSECVTATVEQLTKSYQSELSQQSRKLSRQAKDVVIASEPLAEAVEGLRLALTRNPQVVILIGEPGTGRKTIARMLIEELGRIPLAISTPLETASLPEMLRRERSTFSRDPHSAQESLFLLEDLSLAIIEFSRMRSHRHRLLSEAEGALPSPIFVTTEDERVKNALEEEFECLTGYIPKLGAERQKDLEQLVQKFFFEAAKQMKGDTPRLSASELQWFEQQEWTGNVAQLERVISLYTVSGVSHGKSSPQDRLESILKRDKIALEAEKSLVPLREDPAALFETIVTSGGDLRRSAQHLGCSIAELYPLLHAASSPHKHDSSQEAKTLEIGEESDA
ncbi:hypothetical protein MRY87_06890 [bacterium]|nr:hypothetical protein [bacterium]